jgi:hypothetical protein
VEKSVVAGVNLQEAGQQQQAMCAVVESCDWLIAMPKQKPADRITEFSLQQITLISDEIIHSKKKKTKLHSLSPRENYTDRATAACRRSDCQLVRIEGATWSA